MSKGWRLGLITLLLTGYSLVIIGPTAVSAHATLFRTDPVDGTTLTDAPHQVRMWFTEPIVLDFTKVELVDGEGKHITATNVRRERNSDPVAGRFEAQNVVVMVADLPDLPPNAYRLTWQTRSEDDLHIIKGTVTFGVQRSVLGEGEKEATPAPAILEVGLRWLNFVGFSTILGTLLLGWLVVPSGTSFMVEAAQVQKRLKRLSWYASLLAFASNLGLLIFQGADGATWWQIVSQTSYGLRWLVAEAILAGLIIVYSLQEGKAKVEVQTSQPETRNSARRVGLLLLAVALLVSQALNSHSTGQVGFSALSLGVDILHLLGASMWAGGLLALVWVVGPLLSKGPDERGRAWAILGRFGKLAGLSIMVLIVTGLYKSGQQVASLDGLLTTLYGQALLVKIELVLFGAGLGLLNAAVLHPKVASGLGRVLGRRAGWRPFAPRYLGRALLVEVVSLALVLLVVGLLGTVQPARGPEFDPPLADNTASSSLSTQMSDLVVTLSIKPNRPGQNFLNLGIYNTRRPAPAPIEAVTLQLQPPNGGNAIELPLETQGNGRYQIAGEYLNVAGDWKISLRAIRPGLADTNLTVPWQVGPGLVARRPVVFSNQPVGSWLTLAAIGLSVAAGLGLLLFQARWKLYQKLFNKLTFNQPLKIGRNLRPHPDKREQ